MQLRREEIEQVRDPAPDLRYLNLVLFERVGIMDRRIDAAQIEQRVQIIRGAPGDARQNMQIRPDDAGHLRREAEGRTLKQSAGEADGPGVDLLFFLSRTGRRRGEGEVRASTLAVCTQIGWLKRGNKRRKRANIVLKSCSPHPLTDATHSIDTLPPECHRHAPSRRVHAPSSPRCAFRKSPMRLEWQDHMSLQA